MGKRHVIISCVLLISAVPGPVLPRDAVQRTLSRIDWSAVRQDQERAGATTHDAVRKFLDSAPEGLGDVKLPVLILGGAGDWGAPRFRGQGTAYVVIYTLERAKLSILGSSSKLIAPGDLALEHEPSAFELIGDGADYSFTRYQAAYTLRLACDDPLKDERCTDPQYLTNAANSLIVAGGRP